MGEIKQIIIDNFPAIFSCLFGGGGLFLFFLERKKNRAFTSQEVAKAGQEEATALSNMRQAYKEFTEDMTQRYEVLSEEVKDLKKKLLTVTTQVKEEEEKYDILKTSYDKLKVSYDNLKKEFDNYKKKHSK